MQSSNNAIFIAEYNGDIVGAVDVSFYQYLVPLEMQLTIENIIVDEKYRGRNIGKQLISYIEEYAKENNCHNITTN